MSAVNASANDGPIGLAENRNSSADLPSWKMTISCGMNFNEAIANDLSAIRLSERSTGQVVNVPSVGLGANDEHIVVLGNQVIGIAIGELL